jgi:cardiolipin synthase
MVLLALFEPPLPYRVWPDGRHALDSEEFLRTLTALTEGTLHRRNNAQVFTDGAAFYGAELAAIRQAKRFIHMERYILSRGRVADQMIRALEERARAGVKVRVVFDALGGRVPDSIFDNLRKAGGRAAYYHPIRWYTWPRMNNRTHRELLVVDGDLALVGGAGVADQWQYSDKNEPAWRDTMVQLTGGAASGVQAIFAENWLESTGEILFDAAYFPVVSAEGTTTALVVGSSPATGRSTQARILFQSLIAAARKEIHMNSPYFLPDESLSDELVRAVRDRGVKVRIVVPGQHADHRLTRRASRALYGPLLENGVEIYEYQPSMIHAKIMVVDGAWSVVGSTNMDSRSFALNDEISVALLDPSVATRLNQDFRRDVGRSRRVTREEWEARPWWERVEESIGSLYQRQQ